MDIFFFVTTVVVIVFGIFAAYILWRFGRILKNIEHISLQVAQEGDRIREDLAEMRSDIKKGKGKIKSLFGFLKKEKNRVAKDF